MYRVYCHSFDYSKTVDTKAEAMEVFKEYYLEMLEFVQYSKEWKPSDIGDFIEIAMDSANDFMNGKIKKFHLNPVGMGICPVHKVSIKSLRKIN